MKSKTWKIIRIIAMFIIVSLSMTNCTETNSEAEILSFSFEEQTQEALINSFYKVIEIQVDTSDVSNLVPSIEISPGATIEPPSGVAQDFSEKFIYTVISEDKGTTIKWEIFVDHPNILPDVPNTQSAEDNSTAETGIARVFENVNYYGISEEGKKSIKGEPDSIFWEGNTVTIYYGVGYIISAFNMEPSPQAEGLIASVTVVNLDIHGTTMNGTFTLTLIQVVDIINQEGPIFDIIASNNLTFTEDTLVSTWIGNKQINWNEGYLTVSDASDDSYFISGTSTGVN